MTENEEWRKSSYSGGGQGSDCVEANGTLSKLRDSKNPSATLDIGQDAFARFIRAAVDGRFRTR